MDGQRFSLLPLADGFGHCLNHAYVDSFLLIDRPNEDDVLPADGPEQSPQSRLVALGLTLPMAVLSLIDPGR